MRSPTFNVPERVLAEFPPEISLAMFGNMSLVRYFELGLMDAIQRKETNYLAYLSSGQEAVAAALMCEVRDYMVFAQHRAHDIYLAFGGRPEALRDELLGLSAGTSGGRAGSNCIQCHEGGLTMFGHHGLIGENVPQGVGAALASGRKTLCVFGDGSAEEDYVLAAMGFAATHKLPILFVCMDNNLSILTKVAVRRSWKITDVARSFGLPALDTADDPWAVLHHVRGLVRQLPALINCHVCRAYWHVGVGCDGPPEWDRYQLVEQQLAEAGLCDAALAVKEQNRVAMEKLWNRKLLLKPLRP